MKQSAPANKPTRQSDTASHVGSSGSSGVSLVPPESEIHATGARPAVAPSARSPILGATPDPSPARGAGRGAALRPPTYGISLADRPIATGAPIQTKLAIGRPNDRYEKEADRVADQVMRMPEPDAASTPHSIHHRIDSGAFIQRLAAHRSPALGDIVMAEDDEGPGAAVQTLRSETHNSGTEVISQQLLKSSQGGRAMGREVRQFMEERFGQDFSQVKIHSDNRAATLSRSLGARAFTHGSHIYFGDREYRPETREGKHVLAHELTHVVQQGGSGPQSSVRQHEGMVSPPVIQRLGALPANAQQHGVRPWGGTSPTGSNYDVTTDSGSTVPAWQAYSPFLNELRYWCHGHSLDTYVNHDYSVYSGPPLQTVINDEWTSVTPDEARAGDIAVWTAGWDHSAKFTNPVVVSGQFDADSTMLSSKNGQNALATMSLATLQGIYGSSGIAAYRKK